MAQRKFDPVRIQEELMVCQEGIPAHRLIERLLRGAPDHADEVRAVLATYTKQGPLGHVREYTTARLADLVAAGDRGFASLFEAGLDDPHTAYWSVQGLIRTSGSPSYPRLSAMALDANNRLEIRANAIRELGLHSGQRFIVGLPSSPGDWKELPLKGLQDWVAAGFPDGPGFGLPIRHPSLDDPRTPLEMAASRLESKLAKLRAKRQDPVNPENWLTPAVPGDLAAIRAKWSLPAVYADFLERFSPLKIDLTTRRYYQGLRVHGASELVDGQSGYAWGRDEGEVWAEWPTHYLVIADHAADPFVLDLSSESGGDAPILRAEHGQGDWVFRKEAPSFLAFLEKLAR